MRARVIETIEEIRAEVARARSSGRSVGLVPTMGALHDGHAKLVARARARDATDLVVTTIFVNPTQFGPNEDFSRYPRTLDADVTLATSAGADSIFVPSIEAIYPPGRPRTFVEVPGLSDILEGASRPGHFRGVATVVLKLFNIVGPDFAYFGAKDFQQLAVLRAMAADLDLPIRVVGFDTVREADGLAMSSRNRYLDPEERRAAVVLSRALRAAAAAVSGGERSADRIRQILVETIESEPRATLDYAEVADAESLARLETLDPGREAVALLAARVGPARLIDNALLRLDAGPSDGPVATS